MDEVFENMNTTFPNFDNSYDVEAIREDFPILSEEINGHPLAFLDNGASAQTPEVVLQRMDHV